MPETPAKTRSEVEGCAASTGSPWPEWIEAEKWLPSGVSVLATDLECIWIATFDGDVWRDAEDEPIDSVVTHWMELPDPPDDY